MPNYVIQITTFPNPDWHILHYLADDILNALLLLDSQEPTLILQELLESAQEAEEYVRKVCAEYEVNVMAVKVMEY